MPIPQLIVHPEVYVRIKELEEEDPTRPFEEIFEQAQREYRERKNAPKDP